MSITVAMSTLALVFSVIALIIVSTKKRVVINEEPPHRHHWINESTLTQTSSRDNFRVVGYTYIERCRGCGELKHHHVGLG